MSLRIDVHAHLYDDAFFARMADLGAFEELPIFRIVDQMRHPPAGTPRERRLNGLTVEERLADMDSAGVDLQVLSLGSLQPYFATESLAVEASRFSNDHYAAVIAEHPGRFDAFGVIPLPHVEAAVEEIARVLGELGMAGISLGCSAAGVPLDDDRYEPVWAELDRRGAAVYLHPGVAIGAIPGAGELHLAPDWVSPAEIAVAGARLIVRGILDRHPNVQVILATLGGNIPFLAKRFEHGFRQDHPAEYDALDGVMKHYRRLWYDASVLEVPEILRAAKELGIADRLMLASDFARPGVRSSHAVDFITSSAYLTEAEKTATLDENAARVLGIGDPVGSGV